MKEETIEKVFVATLYLQSLLIFIVGTQLLLSPLAFMDQAYNIAIATGLLLSGIYHLYLIKKLVNRDIGAPDPYEKLERPEGQWGR